MTPQLTKKTPSSFLYNIKYERKKDWEQWFFISGCWHFDNPHCNRELLFHHLDICLENNIPILEFGDAFCLMEGKGDRRGNKNIRPEHTGANYFDLVREDTCKKLEKYREILHFISYGNHETKIIQVQEHDFLKGFQIQYNYQYGGKLQIGNYKGYIRFGFEDKTGGARSSYRLGYFHGTGGGGEVSGPAIRQQRNALTFANADIVVTAHYHDEMIRTFQKDWLDSTDKVTSMKQKHISVPTYKEEYYDVENDAINNSWHVATKGGAPKPLGGAWLKFYWDSYLKKVNYQIIPTN